MLLNLKKDLGTVLIFHLIEEYGSLKIFKNFLFHILMFFYEKSNKFLTT